MQRRMEDMIATFLVLAGAIWIEHEIRALAVLPSWAPAAVGFGLAGAAYCLYLRRRFNSDATIN